MVALVRDLLRQHVDEPEHGDADDRHEKQHHPRQHVRGCVQRLAMEERGVRIAAMNDGPRRRHDQAPRSSSPPKGPFDVGTHGQRVLDKPAGVPEEPKRG